MKMNFLKSNLEPLILKQSSSASFKKRKKKKKLAGFKIFADHLTTSSKREVESFTRKRPERNRTVGTYISYTLIQKH
jgi:hypothetical protein